jgi:transketolase
MLEAALASGSPTYLRLSDQHNSRPLDTGSSGWQTLRRGDADRPTVIAVGPMTDAVLEAVGDVPVTVIATNRPLPLDTELLRAAATETVVVVEPYLEGSTLGLLSMALGDAPRRYAAIGFPREETRRYGTLEDHIRAAGLDAEALRSRLGSIL